MRLFILLYVCFQVPGVAAFSRMSCTYQVKTRSVQTGGSVIIPCSYTKPEGLDKNEEIRVRWLKGGDPSCQQESKVISSPSETITGNYYGRLNTWKDQEKNRTQYLEITELQPKDGPFLCCQIFNNKKLEEVFNKMLGTLLQFSDMESATQLDELIAVPGEDIIIPCHYPKTDSVHKVKWYQVQKNVQLCHTDGTEVYTSDKSHLHDRYSLVNFPKDISLRILNIRKQDEKGYCCDVTTTRDIMSKQVTTLLVTDQESLSTKKPLESSVQKGESITLTCSYNLPDQCKKRDIVQTNVYWRVGNVTGPYAYHPYQEMVYSSYINRTHIIGTTNLLLENMQIEDNKTFHCFVVLKVCKGEGQYEDTIVYGGGTRLNVNGTSPEERGLPTKRTYAIQGDIPTDETSPTEVPQKEPPNYLIIIIVSSAIILIIIILILIVLKVKGVLCRRKINTSEQQMNNIPAPGDGSNGKTQHSEGTKKPDEVCVVGTDNGGKEVMKNGQMEDEDESLLYAKLDETKLNDKSRVQPPKHSEEVVYADVVNTSTK